MSGRRGGVVTQRIANPWTPVRVRSSPPFALTEETPPAWIPETMNKDYFLSIIKQIDHPQNGHLIEMIEDIHFSEQKVKIIVNSELTSAVENITSLWQSLIEKDSKIKSCSVIFTKHSASNLKKKMFQKNTLF